MLHDAITDWLRWLGGRPCFRIYGKARREAAWRIIHVYASRRHNDDGHWPLWRGTCVTWTPEVIAVGWDFAAGVLREQQASPASPQHPIEVAAGRIGDAFRRAAAGASGHASLSEVLAHECGHTWQALRLGLLYLPLVGAVTQFQEGPRPWNHFENEASEQGQFGGLVPASVCPELLTRPPAH